MKKEEIIGSSKSAFYVFDVIELKRRIDYLRSSLPDGISLCYAMKANPFVLKEISDIIEKIQGRPEFKAYKREGIDLPEYEAEELKKIKAMASS